jgi:riboflavin synthase
MFTGLIEQTAEVIAMEKLAGGARLHIAIPEQFAELEVGESIAVNGCCLTLARLAQDVLTFDLLDETLIRTNLGSLPEGGLVNVERALPANGRLGGHFVQGHIDCVSEIVGFDRAGADHRLEVALPGEFAQYVIFKGSIAIDGISLTVAQLEETRFTVWLIPHTISATNLQQRTVGEQVNLEFDLLAKYLERLMTVRAEADGKLRSILGG